MQKLLVLGLRGAGRGGVATLTFQAQVSFQPHRPFISFLSFDVFHSWQDDGRWSWGSGVPTTACKGTERSLSLGLRAGGGAREEAPQPRLSRPESLEGR